MLLIFCFLGVGRFYTRLKTPHLYQSKRESKDQEFIQSSTTLKDKDYCPIEIIKGLTDNGQFQYLTKLMGPQEGTYLYATQFHPLR